MNYKYKKTSENGDATCNYNLVGKFPVKFIDFFKWVLKTEKSFRVEFCATNERYGGWLGNRLEVQKTRDEDSWYFAEIKPMDWFDEIENENITACWTNGGYGQMTYFCTFEEN